MTHEDRLFAELARIGKPADRAMEEWRYQDPSMHVKFDCEKGMDNDRSGFARILPTVATVVTNPPILHSARWNELPSPHAAEQGNAGEGRAYVGGYGVLSYGVARDGRNGAGGRKVLQRLLLLPTGRKDTGEGSSAPPRDKPRNVLHAKTSVRTQGAEPSGKPEADTRGATRDSEPR